MNFTKKELELILLIISCAEGTYYGKKSTWKKAVESLKNKIKQEVSR
jgi:hypothetical protein